MERVPRDLRIPGMLVFVNDYLAGGLCLSAEAFGVLTRLLCYQWQTGHVPGRDPDTLARIAGVSRRRVAGIGRELGGRFVEDRPGEFVNRRCEREYGIARRSALKRRRKIEKTPQPCETIAADPDEIPEQIPLPLGDNRPDTHTHTHTRSSEACASEEYPRSGNFRKPPPASHAPTAAAWDLSTEGANS